MGALREESGPCRDPGSGPPLRVSRCARRRSSAASPSVLALGIGANVAIFSLVNALILKALPIHEPERLVQLQLLIPTRANNTTSFTNPQWESLRNHQDIFTGVTAVGYARFNLNAAGEIEVGTRPVRRRHGSSTPSE